SCLQAAGIDPIDCRCPLLGPESAAQQHRLPAVGQESLIFHGCNGATGAECGHLVSQRVSDFPFTCPSPELTIAGRHRVERALKGTYSLVVRPHYAIVLRTLRFEPI